MGILIACIIIYFLDNAFILFKTIQVFFRQHFKHHSSPKTPL